MLPALSVTVTVCEVDDILTKAMIRFPAALADENGAEMDETPEASVAADWTRVIGWKPGGFTVRLKVALAFCPLASTTWTVKVEVPPDVGLPVITPVLESRVSPGGRLPPVTDHA